MSWNSHGNILASSSQNGVKLWPIESISSTGTGTGSHHPSINNNTNNNNQPLREIITLHHNAPVDRVRFHPIDPSLLCTNVQDKSVQLWDIRDRASQRCRSKIQLKSSRGKCAASVEWEKSGGANHLVVTEKDNTVRIYDVRKLSVSSSSQSQSHSTTGKQEGTEEIKSFLFENILADTHFSPSGTHLVSAARRINDGMGIIHVYPWKHGDTGADVNANADVNVNSAGKIFVGHTGPIYALQFSPDGKSMVCKATIARRTKFIRSVAFSHDSSVVACCSEENGVDLADPRSGEEIGIVSLDNANANANSRDRNRGMNVGAAVCGSDELAFHPKLDIIACARGENLGPNVPQVSIARLQYNRSQ